MGVREATFYVWRKKYAHLGTSEIRELRQLREENAKLKRLVADLSLDKQVLTEVIREKPEAGTQAPAGGLGAHELWGESVTGVRPDADLALAVRVRQSSCRPGSASTADA